MKENLNHIIMDANQNYHRIAYRIDAGLMKRLTYAGEDGYFGLHTGDDITYIFHTLNLMETEFKRHKVELTEGQPGTVFSIAFEGGKNERVEKNADYKSNRAGKVTEDGRHALKVVQEILTEIGYNVYQETGYEADDIARSLVRAYEKDYNHTLLYTNDADWLINLSSKTSVMRYKSSTANYTHITPANFSQVMSDEYGCAMPYNCILLYKSLVGDKSDCVKGVKGFGPKAFDKLIADMVAKGFRNIKGTDGFLLLIHPQNVKNVIEIEQDIIGGNKPAMKEERLRQAYESLELVSPKEFKEIKEPVYLPSLHENRIAVYEKLGFKKLAKAW